VFLYDKTGKPAHRAHRAFRVFNNLRGINNPQESESHPHRQLIENKQFTCVFPSVFCANISSILLKINKAQ
jgi:hypothetical protein